MTDTASRLPAMQTIAKSTRVWVQLGTKLRKQHLEIPQILGQVGPVEPWGIGDPGPRADGMKFHMARGVTSTPQTA